MLEVDSGVGRGEKSLDVGTAEEAFQAQEVWMRTFDAVPDLIALLDREHTVRRVNRALAERLGLRPEEAVGRTCYQVVHGLDAPPPFCPHAELLRDGQEHTAEVYEERLGGWFLVTATPLRGAAGNLIGAVHLARDITALKRAEEALREREALYRRAIAAADAVPYQQDHRTGTFTFMGEGIRQLTGYTAAEMSPALLDSLEQESYMRGAAEGLSVEEAVRRVRAGELQEWKNDSRIVTRDGETRWIADTSIEIRDEQGVSIGSIGILQDITERKQAEEKVRQQLARISLLNQIAHAMAERQDLDSLFRVVVGHLEEHLPVDLGGILLFDPETDTFTVAARGSKGRPLAAELGIPEGTVVPVAQTPFRPCLEGQPVYAPDLAQEEELIPQKLVQIGVRSAVGVPLRVDNQALGVLAVTRRGVAGFGPEDIEFLCALGEHVALAARQAQLYQDLQRAYADLRQTQRVAMQQERLRALGQMASGIAHDISNALTPVTGYPDLLLEDPTLSQQARARLTAIKTAGLDIAHTVARMREFYRSRPEQEPLLPVYLNQLVREVVELTRPRWKDIPQARGVVVEMRLDLPSGVPLVRGIEAEIREALTNLIFNAVDALPEGGTITIRTYGSGGETTPPHPHPPTPTQVVLEVSDTGHGMDEETRQRCLEPFFSTKGARGSGLGLAMVFGVMQRHEGDIEIESEVGRGTTVRLVFPLSKPAGTRSAGRQAVAPPSPRRILYIDDEPMLRTVVGGMLEQDGHTVEVADGGQAGLEAFRAAQARGEPFEVVITDLGMPRMDGRQVAQTVKRESPTTPVILLTGWEPWLHSEGERPQAVDVVLSKPPSRDDLRRALARVAPTPSATNGRPNS